MSTSPEAPRIPKLPFILFDGVVLGIAAWIALSAPSPLGGGSLIAVVALVAVGAVVLGIPFIADYGRRTDALLQERQEQIAALAQSTAATAEQISIAAASLHAIGDVSTRSTKALETLPQKLHEKMAELTTRLNEIAVTGDDALEQEVQTLRSAESDRLVSAIDQLAQTTRELHRLESLTQTHAAQVNDAFAQLPALAQKAADQTASGLARTLLQSKDDVDTLLSRFRTELTHVASAHQTQAAQALDSHLARATSELEAASAAFQGRLNAQMETATRAFDEKLVAMVSVNTRLEVLLEQVSTRIRETSPALPDQRVETAPQPPPAASTTVAHVVSDAISAPAPTSSPSQIATTTPQTHASETEPSRPPLAASLSPGATSSLSESPTLTSTPAPTTSPIRDNSENTSLVATPSKATVPASRANRVARKSSSETSGELFAPEEILSVDAFDAESTSALSVDGATRLLVTAYIGIGNKLFLRGDGAGLSWERGVPLQFVSIGKWRWETNDATQPIQVRLYKNDQLECTAVGTVTLEPGNQHELTAKF